MGTPTGPGFSASFGVCGHFDSAPQNLAALLRTANVVEYEIEENGNVRWQAWEWSGATKSVSLPSDESVSVRT